MTYYPQKTSGYGPSQQQAFADTKAELSSPRILALYNTAAKMKVSADASSFGLGGVLSQEQSNGSWHTFPDH